MNFKKAEQYFDRVSGLKSVTYSGDGGALKLTLFFNGENLDRVSFLESNEEGLLELCAFSASGEADCKVYRAAAPTEGSAHHTLDARAKGAFYLGLVNESAQGLDEALKNDIRRVLQTS